MSNADGGSRRPLFNQPMELSQAGPEPFRVVVAGGGVAAVELLLALRASAGARVTIDLVAPNPEFVYRPLSVAEPFGIGRAHRLPLARIAAEQDARLHAASLTEVDPSAKHAVTAAGERLPYDALVVATGARARDSVHGAFTLSPARVGAYRDVLERLAPGERLLFAVPGGAVWSLPMYEIALMTSTWLEGRGLDVELSLVTPEDLPLGVFGSRVAGTVGALLEERGIGLRCGTYPVWFEDGMLAVRPRPDMAADHVVALPEMLGPALAGLPHDAMGFLPTDSTGAVTGVPDVYAAGDGTSFPVKQGGLAVQQADAVAEVIAARAGADIDPAPFVPILDGLLLTGTIPRYLHADLRGGHGEAASSVDVEPTWWPPTKIAGGHLSSYAARLAAGEPPDPRITWLRLETDDLETYLQTTAANPDRAP